MNNIDDFVAMVRDGLGVPVTVDSVGLGFDELPGWDSVHLLWLVTALERTTGQRISLPDALRASNLENVYELAVRK